VDDEHFNHHYHVRHTAVARPGDHEQLKLLVGRIVSQQLDRGKPLWEIWVIVGLRDGRFAMLVKTHHALADGISAFDLFAALLAPEPAEDIPDPEPWMPHPAPSGARLLRDDLIAEATTPLRMARDLVSALRNFSGVRVDVAENLRAVWDLVTVGLRPPARTPLNRPIGPHRRFEWLRLDLDEVRAVKTRLGGTVNDVVLATVAGAVRRVLGAAGADLEQVEFRVVIPVSVRSENERGQVNNRASGWLMPLPISESDPERRYAAVCAATRRLKSLRQELGPDVLGRAIEYAMPGMLTLGVRLTTLVRAYNLIVTNVPGPPVPLYLLGARLVTGYPLVPLFENQGLGIALFSYNGSLCWGFNADWDAGLDLGGFVAAVAGAFEELRAIAGVGREPSAVAG
jgi:WS/DGAT/MGAT family acyltransferase